MIKSTLCGILFQRVNSKRQFIEPHLARCLGISIGNLIKYFFCKYICFHSHLFLISNLSAISDNVCQNRRNKDVGMGKYSIITCIIYAPFTQKFVLSS